MVRSLIQFSKGITSRQAHRDIGELRDDELTPRINWQIIMIEASRPLKLDDAIAQLA